MILAFNIDFSLRHKDKTYKKGKPLGGQIYFPQINKKTDKKTSQTMKKERQIETVSVCFLNFKTKHTNFDCFMKVALLHILKLT